MLKEVMNNIKILIMLIAQVMIVGRMMWKVTRRERGEKERNSLYTLGHVLTNVIYMLHKVQG